ncbi:MAG: hypothetical protein AAGA30_14210, partial [Planctomycetota bacterium]
MPVFYQFLLVTNDQDSCAKPRWMVGWCLLWLGFLIQFVLPATCAQEESKEDSETVTQRQGVLIRVPLPINGLVAANVQQQLLRVADQAEDVLAAKDRPVVVLEFDISRGSTGRGSSLGACVDLARLLRSPSMNRVTTVGFLPAPVGLADQLETTGLNGHAVLVALATDQLAIAENVFIGEAGIDETTVEPFVQQTYRDIISKRLTLQLPVALAMLDRSQELYRVVTDEDRVVYADANSFKQYEGNADGIDKLSEAGQFVKFTGRDMVELGLLRDTTESVGELSRQLGVSAKRLRPLQKDSNWKAIHVRFDSFIDSAMVRWVTRSINEQVSSENSNLIILEFDTTSGDVNACLLFARFLAGFRPDEILTVAYIHQDAAGPAALMALACQHVIMDSGAKLGGKFDPEIPGDQIEDLKSAAAGIAESIGRDAAVIQAMLAPDLEVIRFAHRLRPGDQRLMTREQKDELVDKADWLPMETLDLTVPLNPAAAQKQGLLHQTVSSFEELSAVYQLEQAPISLQPTSVDRFLQRAADLLTSPFIAPWLL